MPDSASSAAHALYLLYQGREPSAPRVMAQLGDRQFSFARDKSDVGDKTILQFEGAGGSKTVYDLGDGRAISLPTKMRGLTSPEKSEDLARYGIK